MSHGEYLVGYGLCGEFGRFAPPEPLECRPGDKVIVRSRRGVELGTVLCPATEGHLRVLAAQPVRPLLRRATEEDEERQKTLSQVAGEAFLAAQKFIREHVLPLQVLDVEALAEPPLLVVHYIGDKCDYRDLVHGLSTAFDCHVEMLDLNALPGDFAPESDSEACGVCGSTKGCGNGGCGKGGCGSCAAPLAGMVRTYAALGQRW
ncbi:MAG: PSP1 domain-containing protein [Gemmatales bacterium]|nr:PSP1 domain-containing protein [Gemmatales bacterium]MDW8386038.1 PSP1 domain-containing protein [Gemmatales bacterium]